MRSLWRRLAALALSFTVVGLGAPAYAQDDFDDDFGRPVAPPPSPASVDDDPFGDEPAESPAEPDDDPFAEPSEEAAPEPEATEDAGAETASEAPEEGAAEEPRRGRREGRILDEEDPSRRRRFHRHNTLFGPVGGIHVVDAGTGAAGTFRVGLNFGVFKKNGFLADGDQARDSHGVLSLSYTPIRQLEIFASVAAWASTNLAGDPSLIQVLGDSVIGVKGVWEPKPFVAFGGDARVALVNRLGDVGLVGSGTSFGLRTNLSFDLRALEKPKPIIIRWNTGYWFDNSSKVVGGVERDREAALAARPGGISPVEAQDHLVNAIERHGLQINRTDFVDLALGFEFPFEPKERLIISPLLEWNWRIPVNRRGFDCLYVTDAAGGLADGYESCLDREGAKAFPMTIAAGIRIEPKVRGLAFLAAGEVGVTGSRTVVRELAPIVPWMLRLGGSYAFDPNREVTREVVKEVEREVEIDERARIRGEVVEAGAETPVEGALVRFPGRALTPLSADGGSFTSYLFEPGEVEMAVSHPDYEPGKCVASVPEPESRAEAMAGEERLVEVRCELVAKPRLGTMSLRIVSESGAGVAGARVDLTGPSEHTATSAPDGAVSIDELPPGAYQVKVEADDYLIKQEERAVEANEVTSATIALVKRPKRASAAIRGKQISIRRKINFATSSADILDSSTPLLAEVADLLLRNPDVQLVEIRGHTDDRGGAEFNLKLSQERAESVMRWLISAGVDPSRLSAVGFGLTKPLVPNITSANRARNRRVEFVIMERADD